MLPSAGPCTVRDSALGRLDAARAASTPAPALGRPRPSSRVHRRAVDRRRRRDARSPVATGQSAELAITNRPTVSYGPSGSSSPVSSSKSSRLSRPSTSTSPPPRRRVVSASRDVVLVADVADQLLDEVLQRDDAGGAAVLVDDDREVRRPRGASRTARRAPAWSPGSSSDVAGQLADRAPRVGRRRVEQVAHVHEADDVVGGAADHRVARVRLVGDAARPPCTTGIAASRKSTSVRGTITSRICRSPASKTSSTIWRSSLPERLVRR